MYLNNLILKIKAIYLSKLLNYC